MSAALSRAAGRGLCGPDDVGRRAVPPAAVAGLVLLQIIAYSAQSVLVSLSKSPSGGFAYDASSAVVFSEAIKLAVTLCSLVLSGQHRLLALPAPGERSGQSGRRLRWRQLLVVWRRSLTYAVPAMLYVVHNNLVFVAHVYLSAPTYQLLNNIKIIATGIVYRLILRQQLLAIQWVALIQLGIGMACSSLDERGCMGDDGGGAAGGYAADCSSAASPWSLGLAVVMLLAVCSALAGVYTELLIKTSGLPMQVGSAWLYGYGVLASALAYVLARPPGRSMLDGYTWLVWAVVITNSALGIVISFIFKHGDNIVKLFGASMAVLVTGVVAARFLGQRSGPGLWLGCAQATCSLCVFYGDQRFLCSWDSDVLAPRRAGCLLPGGDDDSSCPKVV